MKSLIRPPNAKRRQFRDYRGIYIFGNFSSEGGQAKGELYITNPSGPGLWAFEKLALKSFPESLEQYVKGFGQDLSGEIYVTTSQQLGPTGNTGKVYKLVAKKKGGPSSITSCNCKEAELISASFNFIHSPLP